MPTLPDRVLFGAAYYHEYTPDYDPELRPDERLKTDLDLMAEANFTVIRVGESVWSTWEPENGRFDLDWLQPVLDGAHERGISVIIGTPTYAVPPWLARQYPEITGEFATGERLGWGARQEVDFTHPAFRFHAERVIRAILKRYADHPAIIGYQVDNEPGLELFHNHGVFDLDWLQPVLDGAHERGISVIIGTPTYAVPPWLARKYPEIAGELGTGRRIPWGARQEVDFTHPAFRFHAERVVRAVVGRYADHPGVIGFQVDNEPGLELLHNRGIFESFVDDLRRTYGDVETLNREWGLVYWSHRLSTW